MFGIFRVHFHQSVVHRFSNFILAVFARSHRSSSYRRVVDIRRSISGLSDRWYTYRSHVFTTCIHTRRVRSSGKSAFISISLTRFLHQSIWCTRVVCVWESLIYVSYVLLLWNLERPCMVKWFVLQVNVDSFRVDLFAYQSRCVLRSSWYQVEISELIRVLAENFCVLFLSSSFFSFNLLIVCSYTVFYMWCVFFFFISKFYNLTSEQFFFSLFIRKLLFFVVVEWQLYFIAIVVIAVRVLVIFSVEFSVQFFPYMVCIAYVVYGKGSEFEVYRIFLISQTKWMDFSCLAIRWSCSTVRWPLLQ